MWKYIDESSLIVSPENSKFGNFFKGHVLTFFSEKVDNEIVYNLQLGLLEITTLLDANAIGEIYLFSNFGNKNGLEFIEKYKQVISEVKKKFSSGVSSYKDWYRKATFLYIAENEDVTNLGNSLEMRYGWNFDGDNQKEDRDRKKYAYLDGKIEDAFILKYLNYYIELLHKDLHFNQYKHYAVIVKPIAIRYDDETIPIGNLYLHFATTRKYSEDEYKKFLNEFTSIYLKEKGGEIFKEVQLKTTQSLNALEVYEPNFADKLKKDKLFEKICLHIKKYFKEEKNYNQLNENLNNLKIEFNQNISLNSSSPQELKIEDIRKLPIIGNIFKQRSVISKEKIAEPFSDIISDLYLSRFFIVTLLIVYKFTPIEVYELLNNHPITNAVVRTKKSIYSFYRDKYLLFIKEKSVDKILNKIDIFNQLSKLESDFVNLIESKL